MAARLAGFRDYSNPDVVVRPTRPPRTLDLELLPAFREEIDWVVPSSDLATATRMADAVVYLRIDETKGARQACGFATEHGARVSQVECIYDR